MKWDFVDAYLPSRYFFSEAVLNNIFPFWNPYMLYGIPFYADLVSVFNPEFWIVANMFGYSNITLQFVFIAYIFIAGIGFRYFLRQFAVDESLALSFSIAYMLSGFTIGNAQHLGFICGFALLPILVAAYLKFVWHPDKLSLARVALILLLMIFAGYPGLTIIVAYFLAGIFIYYLILYFNQKQSIQRFLVYHALLVGLVIAGSLVFLLAFFQARPFLSRYGGLTLESALMNPFTIRSFWSFLFPMTTGADSAYFNTDASMSNAYFGLFGLLFFFYALTGRIKEKVSLLFLFSGVFCLLVALGNQFFLREFLFDYFPLMNLFKYPAIFRSLTIFCFLAFAGLNFNSEQLLSINKKRLVIIVGLFMVFILTVMIWSIGKIDALVVFDKNLSLVDRLKNIPIHEAFVLQGFIHLILLSVFLLLVIVIQKQQHLAWIFVSCFAIDGIVSAQLNLHHTVISDRDPVSFAAYLDSEPKGFPIPDLHPIVENSDKNASNNFTWRNNNVFPKRVTFDGLVSFKSDGYYLLSEKYPEVLNAMKQQALFFFSDDVKELTDTAGIGETPVLLSLPDLQKVKAKNLQTDQNDQIKIIDFSPNNIILQTETRHNQMLVFQQNYYHGWQVYVDGKKQEIFKTNFALMSTLVPGGEHVVRFRYKNTPVIWLFVFSMVLFLALTVLLLQQSVKNNNVNRRKVLILVLGFGLLFVVFTILNRYLYQKHKKGLLPEIQQEFKSLKSDSPQETTTFLSYASGSEYVLPEADYQFYLDGNINISDFGDVLDKVKTPKFALGWVNGAVSNEVVELLTSFYPDVEKMEIKGSSGFILAGNGKPGQYFYEEDFNSGATSEWSTNKNRIKRDSITNNRFYTFASNEDWGADLKITIDENTNELNKLAVAGNLRFLKKNSAVNVVISVKRDKEQLDYYTMNIGRFAGSVGEWKRFVIVKEYDLELLEGDVIHIYFWNLTKTRFDIDNLKVKMVNGTERPKLKVPGK